MNTKVYNVLIVLSALAVLYRASFGFPDTLFEVAYTLPLIIIGWGLMWKKFNEYPIGHIVYAVVLLTDIVGLGRLLAN